MMHLLSPSSSNHQMLSDCYKKEVCVSGIKIMLCWPAAPFKQDQAERLESTQQKAQWKPKPCCSPILWFESKHRKHTGSYTVNHGTGLHNVFVKTSFNMSTWDNSSATKDRDINIPDGRPECWGGRKKKRFTLFPPFGKYVGCTQCEAFNWTLGTGPLVKNHLLLSLSKNG